jgi:hypothetical protein
MSEKWEWRDSHGPGANASSLQLSKINLKNVKASEVWILLIEEPDHWLAWNKTMQYILFFYEVKE